MMPSSDKQVSSVTGLNHTIQAQDAWAKTQRVPWEEVRFWAHTHAHTPFFPVLEEAGARTWIISKKREASTFALTLAQLIDSMHNPSTSTSDVLLPTSSMKSYLWWP